MNMHTIPPHPHHLPTMKLKSIRRKGHTFLKSCIRTHLTKLTTTKHNLTLLCLGGGIYLPKWINCQTPTRLGTQPERTWTNLNKSGSELTLFSHVTTTRTRTRRTRTSPNFTLQEGSIGLYLREGERVGVRKVSGGCPDPNFFDQIFFLMKTFLEQQNLFTKNFCLTKIVLTSVWRVSGRCLEGVWKVPGRCLEGVWKVSGSF